MENKYDFVINIDSGDSQAVILRQIEYGSTVLEIGCANGIMTQYMKEKLKCEVYILEINESDYAQAIKFAKDGYCGDVEGFDWIEKFGEIQFDYILFADVLEHLRNPEIVLDRVEGCLKDEGHVILSVPNVCHSGVLAEVYMNNFQYRKLGLLDNTHVHFFSFVSLCQMIESSVFESVIYDATSLPMSSSEFSPYLEKLPDEIIPIINDRPLGRVYQFIFTLVKKEYFEKRKPAVKISDVLSTEISFLPQEKKIDKYRIIDKSRRYLEKSMEDIQAESKTYQNKYEKLGIENDFLSFKFDAQLEENRKLLIDKANAYNEIADQRQEIEESRQKFQRELEDAHKAQAEQIDEYAKLVASDRAVYAREKQALEQVYFNVVDSTCWKLTSPLRWSIRVIKKIVRILFKNKNTSVNNDEITVINEMGTSNQETIEEKIVEEKVTCEMTMSLEERLDMSGHPTYKIETVITDEDVKRINLVTDTLSGSSLLGGVATALVVATEFANNYGYELRIITRCTDINTTNYYVTMKNLGILPAKKISFYSDYAQDRLALQSRLDITADDLFFATSWWSAEAILKTTIRKRVFYIVQEVETMFYNYGDEHQRCMEIFQNPDIRFVINSQYLQEYFQTNMPCITNNGIHFQPAFPDTLYQRSDEVNEGKYKLFFYSRPNNPRNLFKKGVKILNHMITNGILDTSQWDIYFMGQDTPEIVFENGYKPIFKGQVSWNEYAEFLSTIDIGLCLMYTPHPSYPPFDVASSGGVVITNKFMTKQDFPQSKNVIMSELDIVDMEKAFKDAITLAKNTELRQKNYLENSIPKNWSQEIAPILTFMEEHL